jgi:hypothetical protein
MMFSSTHVYKIGELLIAVLENLKRITAIGADLLETAAANADAKAADAAKRTPRP